MTYKGYLIEAEVRRYEFWTLSDNGELDDYQFASENPIEDDDISYAVSDDRGGWQEFFRTLDDAKTFIDDREQVKATHGHVCEYNDYGVCTIGYSDPYRD